MLKIILESKPANSDKWMLRNRLSGLNSELNGTSVPVSEVFDKMAIIKHRWQAIEPFTQFRLTRVM